MKKSRTSKKLDFETLYARALREWPREIKFGPLRRYKPSDQSYTVDGLYDLSDKVEGTHFGSSEEILMQHLHAAVYCVLKDSAATCTDIRLSSLRKEAVQSQFEAYLVDIVDTANTSKKYGWSASDRRLVGAYFDQTRKVQRELIINLCKAAKTGSAKEKFKIGERYYWGTGVSRDHAEAFKWWLAAAECGHKRAQYEVGVMYERGQGTPKNWANAYFWYCIAGHADDPRAKEFLSSKQIAAVKQKVAKWKPMKA